MTQAVLHFKQTFTRLRHGLPTNTAAAQTIAAGYIECVDEFDRFDDVEELRAHHRAIPFEDRRCPVCGGFGCGGC